MATATAQSAGPGTSEVGQGLCSARRWHRAADVRARVLGPSLVGQHVTSVGKGGYSLGVSSRVRMVRALRRQRADATCEQMG